MFSITAGAPNPDVALFCNGKRIATPAVAAVLPICEMFAAPKPDSPPLLNEEHGRFSGDAVG